VSDKRLRNRSSQAAFLCYHSVADAGPEFLTVTPELFAQHLDQIAARGLATGGLAELERIAAGRRLATPTVFITFDDGFRDNYETVLPLLRERGMRAFVFVLPPLVDAGAPLAWPEVAEDARRLPEQMRSVDWSMLEEMKEGGFEVGAHTLSHPHLPELGDEALREELHDSRRRVRERLGSCDTFAYPFGEWSPRVAAAAAECGFRFAFSLPTARGQWRAGELTIPRINVDHRDSGRRFAAKISAPGRATLLSPPFKAARRGLKALRGKR
jgi:peptidoglycan/xylan/chitin deacetylase (PgdA/CDA1 family)